MPFQLTFAGGPAADTTLVIDQDPAPAELVIVVRDGDPEVVGPGVLLDADAADLPATRYRYRSYEGSEVRGGEVTQHLTYGHAEHPTADDVDDFDPRSHPLHPLLVELHAALLTDLESRLDLDTQHRDFKRAVTEAGSAKAPGAETPR